MIKHHWFLVFGTYLLFVIWCLVLCITYAKIVAYEAKNILRYSTDRQLTSGKLHWGDPAIRRTARKIRQCFLHCWLPCHYRAAGAERVEWKHFEIGGGVFGSRNWSKKNRSCSSSLQLMGTRNLVGFWRRSRAWESSSAWRSTKKKAAASTIQWV